MFTGIIETLATVQEVNPNGGNIDFKIKSAITNELKVDQSVAHNGVCLTVTQIDEEGYWVTAVEETLSKTALGSLKSGDVVNLERCMRADGRFDGHMVYGHVDQMGTCVNIEPQDGSTIFSFEFSPEEGNLVVEKGSIALNGISLTVFNVTASSFQVAIIPFTLEHTNLGRMKVGDEVNLEFDIVGKYLQRFMKNQG